MNAKKILGAVAGVLVGATLLACGGGTKPSEGTGTKGDATPGAAAPAESAAEDKKDGPVIAKLGSKGLEFEAEKIDVALSKPGTYKPSAYMDRVPKGSVAFTLTVTLVNRNAEAIKPDGLYITASVGKDNAEAEEVYDSEAGLKGAPSTALLPGKSVKFKVGFMAPVNEANPVINVNVTAITMGNTTGLFQGPLKG